MQITEVTRRNILDELRLAGGAWHGRLDEVRFLGRVVDLNRLPSYDLRFKTIESDIMQHRVNNQDWPDDWILDDVRVNLVGGEDETFLRFLCETIHPVVRPNAEESRKLLEMYNGHLADDGFEIFESKRISNRPVFAPRLVTVPVTLASEPAITAEFVREQLRKAEAKLSSGDYDGTITSGRSLVEGVLGEIHLRCTRTRLPASGDLLADYKRVKDLLHLAEDQHIHEGLKELIRSFNAIIQNIDFLSNKMSDRHRPILKPERHHAKLVLDSAKTLIDFLYSTMEAQADRTTAFVHALFSELNSDKRFLERGELLADPEIAKLVGSSDTYLRRLVKQHLITKYSIDSYRTSDILFAAMRILIDELEAADVVTLYIEGQTNNQAIGWKAFEVDLETARPGLLGQALDEIYGDSHRDRK